MTQGIYGFFLGDESIYIGQSVNCERRMKEEISGKRVNSFFFSVYKKHEKEIIWRLKQLVEEGFLEDLGGSPKSYKVV